MPPHQFGCAACFGDDPEFAATQKLAPVARLIDESHFGISIARCPDCNQHFLRIFTEFVDWADGDDSQYWDLIPVTPTESTTLLAKGAAAIPADVEALAQDRRRLSMSWPKGGPRRIAWNAGAFRIVPGY